MFLSGKMLDQWYNHLADYWTLPSASHRKLSTNRQSHNQSISLSFTVENNQLLYNETEHFNDECVLRRMETNPSRCYRLMSVYLHAKAQQNNLRDLRRHTKFKKFIDLDVNLFVDFTLCITFCTLQQMNENRQNIQKTLNTIPKRSQQ